MKLVKNSLSMSVILSTVLLFSQCQSWGMNNDSGVEAVGEAAFAGAFLNPERGWYISRQTDEATAEELGVIKSANITMVLLETNLGAFLTRPIDEAKLSEIDTAFALARRTGLSVIFRAAYEYDGRLRPDPRDINVILNHIEQLKPLFHKHEDILLNVQAGFFGPWGEWHSSRYSPGGRRDAAVEPQYQRVLVNALLEAVPESVSIALRRPEYIRNIADKSAQNNARGNHPPVTRAEAFGASTIARLAFHNDALMSEETDMDTYIDPNYPRNDELNWIAGQTRFTPMVAETNQVSSYNDSERAIAFLDKINMQVLNIEYHPDVLNKWKKTRHNGMPAFDYIGMMMGYRFVVNKADLSESNEHGGSLRLDLDIVNSGFGHLLKQKKFEIVLKKDTQIHRAEIAEDARFWDKNKPVRREYYFSLPSGIEPGEWEVYLGLSSVFPSLAGNPDYSVRFVNEGMVWDSRLGLNKIGAVNLSIAGSGGELAQFIE